RRRSIVHQPQRTTRHTDDPPPGARDLPVSRVCIHWWPDGLRKHRFGYVPPARRLYRPNSQRREARRAAGPAGDQSGARHQHEDRQGARPHRPAADDWPRRRGDRMKRRTFISLLGGAAAAWPLAARAQQAGKLPTIGLLGATTPLVESQRLRAFVQRLHELGWFEGRNIAIEDRWAEGRTERFAEIAGEFVRLKVDVIVTVGTLPALAAKQATALVPMLFAGAGDPVGTGIVASLARPGGNVTGLSVQFTDLAGKRLELLREVVPNLRRLAIMGNVGNPIHVLEMDEVQVAAHTLG